MTTSEPAPRQDASGEPEAELVPIGMNCSDRQGDAQASGSGPISEWAEDPPRPDGAPTAAGFEPGGKGEGGLLALAALAVVIGALSGLLGSVFRLFLERADAIRNELIGAAQGAVGGFLFLTCVCALTAASAAWLVRRFSPYASGSGIPHVEAVLNGDLPQAPYRLIPVKFFGGVLAIGAGLALGREGPSVQMGASIAQMTGEIFRRSWPDCRVLLAAGAGAGLATAFNAPIAGAVFVLEELVRRFEPRIAVAALGASAAAITVAHGVLGAAPEFRVHELTEARLPTLPLYFVLGVGAGLAAVVYNRLLLWTLAAVARLTIASLKAPVLLVCAGVVVIALYNIGLAFAAALAAAAYNRALSRCAAGGELVAPVELRAGLIGAAVGMIGWSAPSLVGGGDVLTQAALQGDGALALVPLIYLLRLGLGSASYAAGTPGGLFAPMLVLGAQLGLIFGALCQLGFPALGLETQALETQAFAVVGMAAFFCGVVRAPLTGIVLVSEMTQSVVLLPAMLAACFAAMLVPALFGDAPIYDSLRELTLQRSREARADG